MTSSLTPLLKPIRERIGTVEEWLGRKSDVPVDPCRPTCAFMMDYETLEAIRVVVDSNAKLLKCLERMEEAITDADDARNMRGTHLCAGWDCSNCARITNPLYAALDDVRAILEEGK